VKLSGTRRHKPANDAIRHENVMDCAGKVCRDGAFPRRLQAKPPNAMQLKRHKPDERDIIVAADVYEGG
jgi:hypothetical protein